MEERKWLSLLDKLRGIFTDFRRIRKKAIAKDKANRPRERAYTGKAPFTLQGFIKICGAASSVAASSGALAWTSTTAAWSLRARSVDVAGSRRSSTSLHGDCVRVHFDATKAMQGGEAERHPKHIFANPLQPEICSFLALGVLLLRNGVECDDDRMFSNKAGKRFCE